MIDVNAGLIRKIAELSRLELEEGELEAHVRSIGEILKHVEQLSELDTSGVEPMVYGIDDSLRLRPDEVIPFGTAPNGKPRILDHAPDVVDDGFRVPRIIG